MHGSMNGSNILNGSIHSAHGKHSAMEHDLMLNVSIVMSSGIPRQNMTT